MKIKILIFTVLFFPFQLLKAQVIQKMQWDKDFQIHITLANDSNYIVDIKELHHTNVTENKTSAFTYLPTRLNDEFIQKLKQTEVDTNFINKNEYPESNKTMWSALHNSLGGGWVHFINCLSYSIETGYLDITAPLMKRPESKWKPKPMTDSYKRTKNWDYYVPADQKMAIKEYKIKKGNKELGHLNDVPKDFIDLFLDTRQSDYEQMKLQNKKRDKAKIDLIKILIGANYLGETQIKYIKSMVLKAMVDYANEQLPSIIIFDNFNAAVAMSLNETGYQIENIVFADERFISMDTRLVRVNQIKMVVNQINEVNKEVFQQRLKSYYN